MQDLEIFDCSNNDLTELKLGKKNFSTFECKKNSLKTLDMTNVNFIDDWDYLFDYDSKVKLIGCKYERQ